MKRILLAITAVVVAGAASALHPSTPQTPVIVANTPLPVTVQNTPIPVSITDGSTTAINTSRMVNERLAQPANGVPSVAVPDVFSNLSSTTAQVHAYVNSASNASVPCGSDPHPTSVEVNIYPIGAPAVTGLQVPMIEFLSVRKGGADYCGAAVSVGPLFVPPGNQLDVNVVYSTLPATVAPVKFYVNVNGFYKK